MDLNSKIKDLIDKITLKLSSQEPEIPVVDNESEELAAEAALENGDVVMADPSFETGATLSIKVGEAEFLPAEAGPYTLADGMTLVVGEGGVIESVGEVEEPVEQPQEEALSAEDIAEVISGALKPIQERLEKLEMSAQGKDKEIEGLKTELSAAKEAGESIKKMSLRKEQERVDLSKMTVQERISYNLKNK